MSVHIPTQEPAETAAARSASTYQVAVLVVGALLVVSQLYATLPLQSGLADHFTISPAVAALLGTGFGLAFAIGNLVFPTVSDLVDARKVMAAGAAGVALAGLVGGASDAYWLLLSARLAQGFLAAAFPPVALAYVGRALPARHRPVALAAISSCFLLAGIAGQAYALVLEATVGWRWAFWAPAPGLLVVAALVLRLSATQQAGAAPSFAQSLRSVASMTKRPPLLVAYTVAFTLLLTFVGMYGSLGAVAQDRFGVEGPTAQVLLRLPGLPGIILGAFAGFVIRRLGATETGAIAFTVAAVGLGVEAFATPLWGVLAGSGVFVAGLAVAIPSVVTIVGQASGTMRGAGVAGYGFLVGAGASLAPLVTTWLAPWGFTGICAAFAAVTLLASVVLTFGPRPGVASAAAPLT